MFRLFARTQTDPEAELKTILGDYELPTFPAIYMESLQLVRDESSSVAALGDVLASDPGLTMRLLRTVNSAAYGLRSRVNNVHHAVSLLGRANVESMLLSLATHSTLPSSPGPGFEPHRFWKTAARRAATARALADRVDPAGRSECFTAALLQDMALPMLSFRMGESYAQLLERWHSGDADLQVMEREQYGWDHARVAALMCAEWGFPESIAEAIAAHHGSEDPEVHQLPPVNLAALIREVNEELGVEQLVEQAEATMKLAGDTVRELIVESFRSAEEIAQQFG